MKTMQVEVLNRFLTPKQYDDLFKKYRSNTKGPGGGNKNRKFTFEMPVDTEMYAILRSYIQDTDVSVMEIAENAGIKKGALRSKAATAAFKLIYQKGNFFK